MTEAEIASMKDAVASKVKSAVGSGQSLFDLFRDQDDNIGFTYKFFAQNSPSNKIQPQSFDFPEITATKNVQPSSLFPPISVVTDRYVLSGALTVENITPDPVDLCARQRAAVKAKKDEIKSLQGRVRALQLMLHTATPQQKSAIVAEIRETNDEIDQAESQLPNLEAALSHCLGNHIDIQNPVVVADPVA